MQNLGDATGILFSLIQSCRALDIDPFVKLEDVRHRTNGHPTRHVAKLLPHNWRQARVAGA